MTEEQKFRLAAKACGKDLTGWEWSEKFNCMFLRSNATRQLTQGWNPRDDDGDSRRLEVEAQIDLSMHLDYPDTPSNRHIEASSNRYFGVGIFSRKGFAPSRTIWLTDGEHDLFEVARLAVLNCAAAIGEAME